MASKVDEQKTMLRKLEAALIVWGDRNGIYAKAVAAFSAPTERVCFSSSGWLATLPAR